MYEAVKVAVEVRKPDIKWDVQVHILAIGITWRNRGGEPARKG